MKTLSIEQMETLKKLGVDTSKASFVFCKAVWFGDVKQYDVLLENGAFPSEQKHDRFGYGLHNVVAPDQEPVFTLSDILELLPDTIEVEKNNYYYLILQKETNAYYHCIYENLDLVILHRYRSNTMIEAAYNMLLWVIEKGYLNNNKIGDK